MCKQLRIWFFVLLGTLFTSSSLLAEGIITMTTSERVGEEIQLIIKANGNVTIEGAQETGQANESGFKPYRLTSQTITIRGDVTYLNCSQERLTSLDVSGCTALTTLDCNNNKLTSLNLSECTRLVTLYCYSNCINGKAMTKLVNSLPNRRKKKSGTIFLVDRYSERRDKNKYSAAHVATARKKNWEVQQ